MTYLLKLIFLLISGNIFFQVNLDNESYKNKILIYLDKYIKTEIIKDSNFNIKLIEHPNKIQSCIACTHQEFMLREKRDFSEKEKVIDSLHKLDSIFDIKTKSIHSSHEKPYKFFINRNYNTWIYFSSRKYNNHITIELFNSNSLFTNKSGQLHNVMGTSRVFHFFFNKKNEIIYVDVGKNYYN